MFCFDGFFCLFVSFFCISDSQQNFYTGSVIAAVGSWGLLSLVSGPASLLSNIFNISPVPITTAQQKAKHQRSLKMPNGHSSQKRKTGHLSTFNQVLSQTDYTGFCFISKSPIGLDLIHPTLSYCILLDFLNLICCSLYH